MILFLVTTPGARYSACRGSPCTPGSYGAVGKGGACTHAHKYRLGGKAPQITFSRSLTVTIPQSIPSRVATSWCAGGYHGGCWSRCIAGQGRLAHRTRSACLALPDPYPTPQVRPSMQLNSLGGGPVMTRVSWPS